MPVADGRFNVQELEGGHEGVEARQIGQITPPFYLVSSPKPDEFLAELRRDLG